MASQEMLDSVTAEYVNLLTYNKYASRTANTSEFNEVKDMMCVYINSGIGAKKYKHGLALLVAHYYALDDVTPPDVGEEGSDITKGPITKEKAGDVEKMYDTTNKSTVSDGMQYKEWLRLTVYGREYIWLMRTVRSTPRVT
tara:strand:- start:55 stop:477 length:423 start_codon:yes stop_codon:yes gene_type:complete